jgi:glycosyltransferase involved in cell wall biosynthesis
MAKILLVSIAPVGKMMAGPAIRYFEFAKALSKNHEVILLVPKASDTDIFSEQFTIIKHNGDYQKYFKEVDVIISIVIPPLMVLAAKMNNVKIILDLYGLSPFEMLEMHKNSLLPFRKKEQDSLVDSFNFSFSMIDSIICATDNQRDLWTGCLLCQKKITPTLYDQDQSFKYKINLVPFGLSPTPPIKQGIGPKSLFNLKETDKIVLWGGGVWNWFDPLTLIKAIDLISKKRADIHLVFMGVKAPSITDLEILSMSAKAYKLAEDLNILNKHVFFNLDWIPYEERSSFLLEADIGISTHFDHLETRYSYRTRILDYIWAGLPIISTEGDYFSKFIKDNEIGLVVPYENVKALAEAILQLIDHPEIAAKMKKNLESVRQDFYWDDVIRPIEEMIVYPTKKQSKLSVMKEAVYSIYQTKGILFTLKKLSGKILRVFKAS